MLIWTGTATVTNGDATVVVDTGPALTQEVTLQGSMVVLDGLVYFSEGYTDTTTLEIERVYAGGSGTVPMSIWPVSQDTTNLVNLAQIVAATQRQINILDKNSQGLFFMMKGVTGAADPGPGFIAFDDADATLVTEAYIDALDANGRAVSELVGLWEAGTTIVVRSLSTTAYRAYTVATNTDGSGWATLALTYVGHDGVLADNEALAVSWSIASAGLEINASGNFADRDLYDDEPAGFVFLSADGDGDTITVGTLFRKNSATTADWGPAVPFQGPDGDAGWSPVFAVVSDGERRVLRLVDYVGGEGTKPTAGINQYVSAGGLTGTIGSATDIRGPVGLSAYEVAVAEGFVGDEAAWLASLNGADGDDGADGEDGTDPGALFNWDDGTADADPGVGNMRANTADLSLAAFLYVSKEGRTGDDLEAFLLSIGDSTNAVKGHVTLTSSGGSAQAIVAVDSLTDATGYVKIGLIADSHSGATGFVDATAISLQWNRAGNQGSSDAISVASAINGSPEVTDPDAATKFAITDPNNGDLLSWISFESLGNAIKPRALVDAKAANYTVLVTDLGKNLNVDASAANRTITLPPAAAAANGFEIGVRKSDSSANTVTIDADGSETINGLTTLVLRHHREAVRLVCNGTAWFVSVPAVAPVATGAAGQVLRVNSGGDGTEWADPPSAEPPDGSVTDPKLAAALKAKLVAFAADRIDLAAMNGDTYQAVDLMEAGRKGLFVWDGSDLSAEVTADTEQGLYVAPASDATGAGGAWVRQYDGPVLSTWFGAHPDNADNTDAYDGMISALPDGAEIYWPKIDGIWAGHFNTIGRTFHLDLGGNTFSEAPAHANRSVFSMIGEMAAQTTLSANAVYGDRSISVTSATGLSAGQLIMLEDAKARPSDGNLVNQELLRIESLSGTAVQVEDMVRSNQNSGTRNLYLLTPIVGPSIRNGRVEIQDPRIPSVNDEGHAGASFRIWHADGCVIENVHVENHYGLPVDNRYCYGAVVNGVVAKDPADTSVGGYGPLFSGCRASRMDNITAIRCRNVVDLGACYDVDLIDIRKDGGPSPDGGYGIAIAHNLYGGFVRIDGAKLFDVGSNAAFLVSAQSIANPQNHVCRDVTIRNVQVTRADAPDTTNRTAIYVQCGYADWIVDGLNMKYAPGGGAVVTGASVIRTNGQCYGNSVFRNISCPKAGFIFYTEQGGTDGTGLAIGLVRLENLHLNEGSGIVQGRGIKHLASTNLTMSTAAGTGIKNFSTVNGIANVTNESIGVHAVVS